jgi:hypothetical protein
MGRIGAAAVLSVALLGCAEGDFSPRPHQAEALQLVWADIFGETHQPPPIGWRQLECGDPAPWFDGYVAPHQGFVDGSECKSGFYETDRDYINVAWLDAVWRTSIVHELFHAHLKYTFGDADGEHRRTEWGHDQVTGLDNPTGYYADAIDGLSAAGY